jgi:hypothetical protein
MDMNLKLRKIINLLENYRVSETAHRFLARHPHEWKRRENYLNFIIKSLWQCLKTSGEIVLLRDDLFETLEHGFYHDEGYDKFTIILRLVFNLLNQVQPKDAWVNMHAKTSQYYCKTKVKQVSQLPY